MLSKEKKQALQAAQGRSQIMTQNVKVAVEDIIDRDLTIADYDRIGEDTEEKHHYFAVTFEELPGNFVLSGTALTDLIDGAEADGEDIRGEKVRFGAKQKLKSGRTFVPCILL